VIIPVHNVEDYLNRCLDSIVSQTYSDFECILVDDCSTDESPKICDEYAKKDSRFKVIHNAYNEGSSKARKTGLENSCGRYIQYVDSDDWIEPDMLEKMYCKAVSDDCDVVYCDFVRFGTQNVFQCDNVDATIMSRNDVLKNILAFKLPWMLWNKLIKRELFDSVSFPVFQYGEDAVICVQIFNDCSKVGYVKLTLYHWFANPNSLAFSLWQDVRKLNDALDNFKIIASYLKDKYGRNISRLQPELDNAINVYKIAILQNGVVNYRIFELLNFRFIISLAKLLVKKCLRIKIVL
jgi:glycosyltransferase involved in cell wall biosynthesis